MNTFRVFVFCLAFTNSVYSQLVVTESSIFKSKSNPVPTKVLGEDKNSFYFLKGSAGSLSVEKYSKNDYNILASSDIKLNKKRDVKFLEAYHANGNSLIFRQNYDNTIEEISTFMQIVKENGEVVPEFKEIYNFKTKLQSYFIDPETGYWFDLIFYHFSISDDKNTIAIIAEEHFWDGKNVKLKKIHVKFLDTKTLKIILEKSIPQQYATTKIKPWNYKIDNKLNLYFCFGYFNDENKLQYSIGYLAPESSSVIAMDVSLDAKYHVLVDIDYRIDSTVLFCSVLYKSKIKEKPPMNYSNYMGLSTNCFSLLDFKTVQTDSLHFPKEIIERINDGSGDRELCDIFFISSIERVNNEYYTFVFEYKYLGATKGPIIIYKNDINNKIAWTNVLLRGYSSMTLYDYEDVCSFVLNTGSELKIIYPEYPGLVDMIKTEDLSIKNIKRCTPAKSDIVCATISPNGKIDRSTLIKDRQMHPRFYSFHSGELLVPLDRKSFLMFFSYKKKYQFYKLALN